MTTKLVRYDAARRALQLAKRVDEVKDIRDKAQAMAAYARQAKDTELLAMATEIKVRAERRAGKMLREMAERGERDGGRGGDRKSSRRLRLEELGIDKSQSSRWQKVAAIAEDEFEKRVRSLIETVGAVTTAGVVRSPHGTFSQSNEWYTPAQYIEAARKVLGGIDLDPASCDLANRTVGAKKFYDASENGLAFEWAGRVWLNPPWGDLSADFISKLVAEFREGKTTAAIALVNAHATDTDWFQPLWNHALCFTDHRIDYNSPDDKHSSSTHGSVFVYMGPRETAFAQHFSEWGTIVKRWP